MAIIKNEITMLEADTDGVAVINLTHKKTDLKLLKKRKLVKSSNCTEDFSICKSLNKPLQSISGVL